MDNKGNLLARDRIIQSRDRIIQARDRILGSRDGIFGLIWSRLTCSLSAGNCKDAPVSTHLRPV